MIPPDLLTTIRKEAPRLSSLRLIEDPAGLAIAFGGGKPSRPIMKGLSDLTGRLAWMQKQGIDKQVNGGWPDWFGSDLPAGEGETWCRLMNDGLLSAAKAEPRFVPLATLPHAGRRPRRGRAQGRDGGGLPWRHDLDLAARDRQRA